MAGISLYTLLLVFLAQGVTAHDPNEAVLV